MARNTAAIDPLLGRVLGRRYEIVALIAQGGMATVYRAYDRQLDRTVAVKVPRPEFARDRGFSEQFRREARAAARLGHPNIVAVYDSGEERGLPYIVMELVTGQTLRQVLDARGRLTPQATAELLAEVAEALDSAHGAGVVHLDVKPENVLITKGGAVKVADFGLVRAVRDLPRHELAGTVQYVAPEVLRGDAVDGRADIYALGVVAFECLTGRAPFDGPDRREVARRHLEEQVPPPGTLVPGIPPAVDEAVRAATDPDPARRYRRATDFTSALGAPRRHWTREALSQTQALPVVGPDAVPASRMDTVANAPAPVGPRPRPAYQARARHWPLLLLGTALLVLAAVVGWPYVDPTEVAVPELTGLTLEQARQRAEDAGLRLDEGDPVDSQTVPKGTVAVQIPEPGGRIRRSKPIVVQVSNGPRAVEVPNVEGRREAEAKRLLGGAGLEVDVEKRGSDSVEQGRVIGTEPAAGEAVPQGSTVKLLVSLGPPRVMGDARGHRFEDVKRLLEALGFKVKREDVPDEDIEQGRVVGTDPEEGEEVEPGDEIVIFVSSGDERVRVPNVRGDSREEAEGRLREAGLEPQFIGFDGRVVEQFPRGGSRARPGDTVTVVLGLRD